MKQFSRPFISIIMPIRNEADFIVQSLGAVLAQDYHHNQMEVIIADGMSDDNTRQIIQELAVTSDIAIKIIDNANRIVPTGFNAALKQAKGEVIVRVDGHCEIAPDYVSQCVEHLLMKEVAGVGGPIETIGLNRIGETIALAMSSTFGVGGSAFRTIKDKTMYVDTIAFPTYWRKVMDHAGELDEEMVRNQDDEYNYRLRALGYKLLLSPRIKSRYYSRGSLRKLWKQYYQYGFYKVRVMQKHPRQMSLRQFVPPLFVASLFVGAPLAFFGLQFLMFWCIIIILYLIASFFTSIVTSIRFGWQHLITLPIIFGTIHFSYGLGFLYGLVKFRYQWSNP
jgi:succinoglycan biosynthesis protein ExoA